MARVLTYAVIMAIPFPLYAAYRIARTKLHRGPRFQRAARIMLAILHVGLLGFAIMEMDGTWMWPHATDTEVPPQRRTILGCSLFALMPSIMLAGSIPLLWRSLRRTP